jgi:acetyl esterase/lipase
MRSQFGELFRPDDDGPHPVAVVIHGGFWRARYSRKLNRGLSRALADRGWAAWNLEYRRLGRLSGGGWPNTFADVGEGIDHLDRLLGLDLSRVVAIGHSAGGHLAAWAATREAPRVPITGVVSQAGVVDLRMAWELRLSGGVVRRLLDGTPEERPDRYRLASPAERLPLGVPILLVHGALDDIVPPVISERFAEAARAAGDDCTLHVVPGEDHMGHIDLRDAAIDPVFAWLDR